MALGWSLIIGNFVFWAGLITAIILYSVKRKWSFVMYLISLCLYIFTFSFIVDAFDLSKNWILFMLAISAVLMIGAGFYISRKFMDSRKK